MGDELARSNFGDSAYHRMTYSLGYGQLFGIVR